MHRHKSSVSVGWIGRSTALLIADRIETVLQSGQAFVLN